MTDRELMQQALDALEVEHSAIYGTSQTAKAIKALRARLAQPEQESAYGYASRLATAIWEKHYKDESPHWKVNDSLLGVLTQIDNMTTGLVRAQPEQEIEPDRLHVEDDGFPTEKAVLQRFWREHQAQPEQEQCHHKFEVDQEAPSHSCCQMCGEVRKQPEQEPVAWRQWVEGNPKLRGHWMLADPDVKDKCLPQGDWQPLYTAPPQREWQGLTDEQVKQIEMSASSTLSAIYLAEAQLKGKNT